MGQRDRGTMPCCEVAGSTSPIPATAVLAESRHWSVQTAAPALQPTESQSGDADGHRKRHTVEMPEPQFDRHLERWCWAGPVGCGRPRIREAPPGPDSAVSLNNGESIHSQRLNWPAPSPQAFEHDWNEQSFELHRVDPEIGDGSVEYLLDDADIAFVLQHCRCYYCDRAFRAPLSECPCGKAFWDGRGDIHAAHPKCPKGLVRRLIDRRKAQRASVRRASLLRASEGKHVTVAEKAALYQAQAGLCYYCGVELIQSGPGACHHDHFVPLALGGRRDLENAVLACPPCNLHKNDDTGLDYLACRSRRKSEDPALLRRMRKAFHSWRLERGFRSFEELVSN